MRETFRRKIRIKRFGSGLSALIILMNKCKGKAKSRQLEVNVFNREIHFRIDGNDNLILVDPTITDNNKVVITIINV
jgi:hypothetical protein